MRAIFSGRALLCSSTQIPSHKIQCSTSSSLRYRHPVDDHTVPHWARLLQFKVMSTPESVFTALPDTSVRSTPKVLDHHLRVTYLPAQTPKKDRWLLKGLNNDRHVTCRYHSNHDVYYHRHSSSSLSVKGEIADLVCFETCFAGRTG